MRHDGLSFYSMRVLPSELADWLALGWMEEARDFVPSLGFDQVLILFNGSSLADGVAPPVPYGETP